MSSNPKTLTLTLEKELYPKNAIMLTVFDHVDSSSCLVSTTNDAYVLKFMNKDNFDEEKFLKDLTVNVAKEIIEERTSHARDAIYMASVVEGLTR